MKSLPTVTTVEFSPSMKEDNYKINGRTASIGEEGRVRVVIDTLRKIAGQTRLHARVESRNPAVDGKGLGYSSSGFAALGLASATALKMSFRPKFLSQIVRLGAGSASRSLVGGFSIWYADHRGISHAEQLAKPSDIPWRTVIIPVPSGVRTDEAHEDALTSPFYKPRLAYVKGLLPRMKTAIKKRDTKLISSLAEIDTLNLHAVTMTGKSEMILFSPMSLRVIEEVTKMREEDDLPVWYSLDTGPSVFVNTLPSTAARVARRLARVVPTPPLLSEAGGEAEVMEKHLF